MSKYEVVMEFVHQVNPYGRFPAARYVSTGADTLLDVPIDIYDDMGSPEYMTLTLEPGDKLNGDDQRVNDDPLPYAPPVRRIPQQNNYRYVSHD